MKQMRRLGQIAVSLRGFDNRKKSLRPSPRVRDASQATTTTTQRPLTVSDDGARKSRKSAVAAAASDGRGKAQRRGAPLLEMTARTEVAPKLSASTDSSVNKEAAVELYGGRGQGGNSEERRREGERKRRLRRKTGAGRRVRTREAAFRGCSEVHGNPEREEAGEKEGRFLADDPGNFNLNLLLLLPPPSSHESLCRDSHRLFGPSRMYNQGQWGSPSTSQQPPPPPPRETFSASSHPETQQDNQGATWEQAQGVQEYSGQQQQGGQGYEVRQNRFPFPTRSHKGSERLK
jgi:hypothetical protein